MEGGHSSINQSHPKEAANILSSLSFFYDLPIFFKGYRNSLETTDLYKVLTDCRSTQLGDELEQQWQLEIDKKQKPSICRALWICFGKTFLVLGLIQLVFKTATTVWLPEATSKLVSYFSPDQEDLTRRDAFYYASVVIGLTTLNLFFYYNCMLALTELGIRVRTSVCSLLYRKSLKLTLDSLSEVTVGKIITIMTKDVDVFFNFIYYGNDVWIPLVQTAVVCYLIYSKIGVAAFAGIGFFLIVLPLQIFIGKMSYPLRLRSSKKTDERLELIQEVLSSIKIIKMYTWETFFERKINTARKEELHQLVRLFFTKVWIVIIGSIGSKLAFFVFFLTYVYLGDSESRITAEIVYYLMSCCTDLEYSLSTLIPIGLSYASEAYATTKRIQNVLTAKELLPKQTITETQNPKIVFSGVDIKIQKKVILTDVSFVLKKGLHVISGHTGSGKTTLLKFILQEYQMDAEVKISGNISYASQEPWLFPSTIRNNILFGEKYSEERYQEVLRICNLDYDLNLLPEGDNMIVGDHGINLSKGQQTRINLARAMYKDSDIYLLDDCLASLDVYVSGYIFDECIRKFLKDKLCVFVTNNNNFVSKADTVIVVNEGSVKISKNVEEETVQSSVVTETRPEQERVPEVDKQIYHENKKSGKVSLTDYRKYVSSGGGYFAFGLVMALFVVAQGASSYGDKLLSNWVTLEQNLSRYQDNNDTKSGTYQAITSENTGNLYLIIFVAASSILLTLIKYLSFFTFTKTASVNLHKIMVQAVLNSTMSFFDSNFLGNILNRFSKDCLTVDENLPYILIECLSLLFMAAGGIILMTTVNIVFLIESACLLIFAYTLKKFCQPTGRNLQRLNVATRSPMIGHLNSTLEGLTTIRASNVQERLIQEFDNHQNLFTSANYMLNNCQIALGFGLEFFCTVFITLVIIQFLITTSDPSVGDVGLALTQCFVITDIISSGIKNISDCENLMTSVERIVEYSELKEEDKKGPTVKNWPTDGKIQFGDVSLTYDNKTTLHNINFTIEPNEKLGIVGRTGAGKSSIISTLLRMYQIEGKISIDDINIQEVSLQLLRSHISIVPQDPFLFSGTVRDNLDPLKQYEDENIWKVLEQLHLRDLIGDLNIKIDKSSSFSAGQKQLFCLARAALRKSKIVILDEISANVDKEAEDLIQQAVKDYFGANTVITIAHKLESILTCDKVLVLDKGCIKEFGSPVQLLENKNSFLCSVT
ncbi:probable multidrug resistance-associated protein lethal(2)03659 [Zophobas morio]|uniref:probable multidrug resistance-associated protein lethal(2)03659 n=1 Tax=Zophobas morio TaxID=2755281 RepID=UPI003082E08D